MDHLLAEFLADAHLLVDSYYIDTWRESVKGGVFETLFFLSVGGLGIQRFKLWRMKHDEMALRRVLLGQRRKGKR